MFGFLKNLLRKPVEAPAEKQTPAPVEQDYEAEAEAAPQAQPPRAGAHRQNGRGAASQFVPQPQRAPAQPAGNFAPQAQSQSAHGRAVQVPLQPILDGLPLELQPRVVERQVGDLTISIPLEKVLSQLSRGSVRISFGELRQLAPDIFSAELDRDRVAVPLPLNEILSRLNPALIARRRVQKQIEVPQEISSPFDPGNQGLIFHVGPSKPEPSKSSAGAPHRNVTPAQTPAAPSLQSRNTMTSAPTPSAPSLNQATPGPISFAPRPSGDLRAPQTPGPATPKPAQPGTPISPIAPGAPSQRTNAPGFDSIPSPIRMTPKPTAPAPGSSATPTPTPGATPTSRPLGMPTPRPAVTPTPTPAAPAIPGPSGHGVNPGRGIPGPNIPGLFSMSPAAPAAPAAPTPQPAPASHTPQPVRAHPQQPAHPQQQPAPAMTPRPAAAAPVTQFQSATQETLMVPITSLAEGWPEPVRKEVVQLGLVEAKLALPVDMISQALKQGRIAFPWQTLRSWIKGATLPVASPNDGIIVELPLKVVAPLFLNRQKEGKDKQKVNIDSEIPNLFFGFPQSENNNNPAVTKPADTNYYTWDDQSDTAHITADESKKPSIETRFVSKCATPNEVVSRAAALDGVAGALIALPDGLMVASRISPDLNGETLAAFLPQIFSKMTQCTKELRMGELNNLHFTVGNVPWKIFRVNAIFFAAFGRAGEAMPTAQLSALAAELDHKPK